MQKCQLLTSSEKITLAPDFPQQRAADKKRENKNSRGRYLDALLFVVKNIDEGKKAKLVR